MPAPLAPLLGFSLGVLFAWLARTDTPHVDEPPFSASSAWDRPTLAVALYALLVYAPVSAYFAIFTADWSFAYLVDGRAIPSALTLVLVLLDAAAPVAGFIAGRHAIARRSLTALAWLAALPVLAALLVLVGFHARFGVDASFHQVQSDFGVHPLPGSPLGYVILWMDVLLVAGAVFTANALSAAPAPRTRSPRSPSGATPNPPVPTPEDPSLSPSGAPSDEPRRLLGQSRRPR